MYLINSIFLESDSKNINCYTKATDEMEIIIKWGASQVAQW